MTGVKVLTLLLLFWVYWRLWIAQNEHVTENIAQEMMESCKSGIPYSYNDTVERENLPEIVKLYFKTVLPAQYDTYCYFEIYSHAMIKLSRDAEFAPIDGIERVTTDKPGFLYTAYMIFFEFAHVWVREQYLNGQGWGYASIMSLLPVRDEKSAELSKVALFRFASDLVFAPFVLVPKLSPFVTWRPQDAYSAELTITDGGNQVEIIVSFRPDGTIRSFSTKEVILGKKWIFSMDDYRDTVLRHGTIRIPTRARASFKFSENDQYDYLIMHNARMEGFHVPL